MFQEDGTIYGDAIYRNNVSWNTQPNQVKGDRHLILNNTIINSNTFGNSEDELFNMSIQGFKAMHEIMGNEHSITRNNLANLAHRSWALKGKTRKELTVMNYHQQKQYLELMIIIFRNPWQP